MIHTLILNHLGFRTFIIILKETITDDTYQDIDLFFSAISFSPVTIPSIESIQRDRPITEITFATYGKCVS